MEAIVCREPGTFELFERERPVPGTDEVLLRIHRVGICGTDLHAFQGNQAYFTYPRILGHELSAEIVATDAPSPGRDVGDRVIIMPYVSCGHCVACRAGKTNCCRNIAVLGVHADGGMQQYISVPQSLVIPAGSLSHDEIAIVEPLAIGAHALRRAAVREGDTLAVVGCGPIGIGIAALARLQGCRVIALDTNPHRLEFVRERIDIPDTVQVGDGAAECVADLTGGDLARVVFDATGHRGALESGIQYMSHGGSYVLVGLSKGELTFSHPAIHAKESSILCSRNATRDDFLAVRAALESGGFPTEEYITHRAGHRELIARFGEWLKPETGVIKAMVDWV